MNAIYKNIFNWNQNKNFHDFPSSPCGFLEFSMEYKYRQFRIITDFPHVLVYNVRFLQPNLFFYKYHVWPKAIAFKTNFLSVPDCLFEKERDYANHIVGETMTPHSISSFMNVLNQSTSRAGKWKKEKNVKK